jgi:cell division septal protein FtsQ
MKPVPGTTPERNSNLREQVVTQKVGNRSGIAGKGRSASAAQRPARRERETSVSITGRMRQLSGYVPVALKIALILGIATLVFLGYRAAASASFFQIRNVETRGISRASNDSIVATVRRDVNQTGVWRADLSALSSHLEQLPWVRTAIVTRVLPDGIRVRITERQPSLVIRSSAGRFMWVDEDAVELTEMQPADQMPPFFLRGWDEQASASARTENLARVRRFLELQKDWDTLGLSERVSEVNLIDTRDVRAQLAGDDSQIEIRLGAQDLGQRLKKALNVLDSQRQTSRGPLISYIDMTQGKHAIVGLTSGSHVSEMTDPSADTASDRNTPPGEARARTTEKNTKDQKARNQIKKPDQKRT